jgi:glycosyltransferase involved in cell wall biosynthesis
MFLTYKEDISFIESKATRSNDWNICYAGSLKGSRNLSTFIMGLAAAISVKPKIKDCVKIKLAGIGEGFDDALRLAREYQLESCFNFKGLLTGSQANNLMADCDTLLIVQPSDNDLEIPGKIFQMMSFKKNIIGLMDPKSETASIINKSGLGYVSPIADVQDIQGVILQLYEKHLEGSFNLPNDYFIESFSESKLSNSLSKVLSNLITAP